MYVQTIGNANREQSDSDVFAKHVFLTQINSENAIFISPPFPFANFVHISHRQIV